MKILKATVLLTIFSVVISLCVSQAYSSPSAMTFAAVTLKADHTINKTDQVTKTSVDNSMYYENVKNFTSLTNPCTKCIIGTTLYDGNGKRLSVSVQSVMGQTVQLGTNAPGDYMAGVWRVDTTALKTTHSGVWWINRAPN